ncbi:MAG: hypothetical protein LBM70_07155, partial [Victivallales bacterium]|nr:hypothetical protein [Victivallales bacterium]
EIDENEAKKLQEKLRANKFDYNDFLTQLRQIKKLGGMESILKFLPGGRQLSSAMSEIDPRHFTRMEAVVLSMTKNERENPNLMDFSRKKRIAKGSGVPVETVSALIKQIEGMRKLMKQNGPLGRLMAGGALPENPGTPGSLGGFFGASTPLSRKDQDKKKRLAKLAKKQRAKQRKKH